MNYMSLPKAKLAACCNGPNAAPGLCGTQHWEAMCDDSSNGPEATAKRNVLQPSSNLVTPLLTDMYQVGERSLRILSHT